MLARGLLALAALCPALAFAVDGPSTTPLLDYALKQRYDPLPDATQSANRLKAAEHRAAQLAMPTERCARSLGAKRFAAVWSDLGAAHSNRGDTRSAIAAYRRALDCSPRNPDQLADLATELLATGEASEARTLIDRGLTIEPEHSDLNRLAGEQAFIAEQFGEAREHFRTHARLEREPDDVLYAQIMLWLAERRAGATPAKVLRRRYDKDEWPYPIWRALRGEIDEAALLESVWEDTYPTTQERLCEALYYLGQERLARGETDIARRYFAAVVNTRVLYFVEHRMARAELERLRQGRN
jgi:lipoprotein NlpI